MPQIIALLNPTAKNGKAAHLANRKLPTSCEVVTCTSAKDLEAQAHAAAQQNAETIIAFGGDGTIHHAANGILRAENSTSALAVVPAGTANDYWATLKDYLDRDSQRELLVDVGHIRQGGFERFFINALGVGFSAETAVAAQNYKKWPPRMRYVLGVIEATRHRWALAEASLQFDYQTQQSVNLFLLSVAKGRREGSFTLAPKAKLDDGYLHVLTATDLLRRDVVRYLPGVCFGKLPPADPRIRFSTARRLLLKSPSPLRFHLDGELIGESDFAPEEEIEIRVLSKRLRMRSLS